MYVVIVCIYDGLACKWVLSVYVVKCTCVYYQYDCICGWFVCLYMVRMSVYTGIIHVYMEDSCNYLHKC